MVQDYINPVVVIPVYKELEKWEQNEFISLHKCCQVLSKYTLYFIGPKKINWAKIQEFTKAEFKVIIKVALFEDTYFANIPGYNKLLKSLFFYEYFKEYSHLLLYQLDAYVFKDELKEWCEKEIDYIGAPWVDGFTDNSSSHLVGVGNGGFSLHNIPAAIKVLRRVRRILPILETTENSFIYNRIPQLKLFTRYVLLKLAYNIGNQRYIKELSLSNDIYEDIFWGKYIPTTFSDFKVAGISEAIKFSFEVNPKYLYQLNNQELPFGCHAWEKYDPSFWSQYIEIKANKA